MEYSDVSNMRDQYMSKMEVPAMSVITQQLGEPLAQVMFDSSPEPLKYLCGLTPTLKGAGDQLWRSPSDLLVEKVALKPPLTSKHIQALTHQGILSIGVKIEKKLLNEMVLERRKGLEEQEQVLRFMFDKEKREAIQRVTEEQQRLFEEIMENYKSEFDEKLQQQLHAVETEVFTELSTVIDDPQDEEANIPWKEKHNDVVMKAVKLLTKEFLDDLEQQKKTLRAHYEEIIKRLKLKCSSIMIERYMHHKDMMRQLRHYLECKNIANMMYILCMERRKCQTEREKAENHSKKKVQHLNKKITKQRYKIKDLKKQLEDRHKKLKIREYYLIQILKQFQKFINFVLKSTPTQAEFMLNIEKIARAELDSALNENSGTYAADLLIQPWSTSSASSSKSSATSNGLIINDHHNCLNEEDVTSEDDSEAEHPIVYYNKNMYVREDFRNMLSQGIKIAPDNLLWSKDVAKLLKVMKQSVNDDGSDLIDEHVIEEEDIEREIGELVESKKEERKVGISMEDEGQQPLSAMHSNKGRRRSSGKSASVHFDPNYFAEVIAKHNTTGSQATEIKSALSKRFYPVPEFINHDAVGSGETKPTLLGSSDSLDLIMKTRLGRKWRRKIQKTKEELTQETQTSFPDLPITVMKDEEQIQVEEVALKVITPTPPPKPKKKKKRKSVIRIAETTAVATSTTTTRTTAVEKVRAAIEAKKYTTEVTDIRLPTKRRSSFRLEVKDSLIKHRRSLIPSKLEEIEKEKEGDLKVMERKKSRLSMSRDSIELARESFHIKTVVKKAQESKLSLARDSIEVIRKRRSSMVIRDGTTDDDKIEIKSNLSLGRGSFEMLGTSTDKLARVTSKLEMARDSLEILRKTASKLSFNERRASAVGALEEFRKNILNNLDDAELSESRREPTSIIKFDTDDPSKAVKISHVEIVEVDDTRRRSNVFFHPEAEIIDPWMKADEDALENVYKSKRKTKTVKKRKTDDFLHKPNQARIAGDRNAEEHLQTEDEFMLHRISSFISLLKQNPSLARVFTSVSK